MSAECIGKKLRTESSDSVAILLGAAGWPIGSALLLVAPDACRGVAPATTGTTMAVPLFEKCGPSGTCKTVLKNQDPSMHTYMYVHVHVCISDFDHFLDSYS